MLRTAWEGDAGHSQPLPSLQRPHILLTLLPPLVTFPATAAALALLLRLCGVQPYHPDIEAALEASFLPAAAVGAAMSATATCLVLFALASTVQPRTRGLFATLAAIYITLLLYLVGYMAGALPLLFVWQHAGHMYHCTLPDAL